MNNRILLAIGLGLGYYLLNQKKERLYFVPNVGNVKESELFRYGYIEQPIGSGKYYTQAQINAAAIQAGAAQGSTIDPNSQTFNTILTILNGLTALVPIAQTIVTAANRPQKIQEILNKYTSTVSISYTPTFPYSQTMLKGFSNEQLSYILDNGTLPNINGVYSRKVKNSRECNNGQYSTAAAQGACSYNGGLKGAVKNVAKSKKKTIDKGDIISVKMIPPRIDRRGDIIPNNKRSPERYYSGTALENSNGSSFDAELTNGNIVRVNISSKTVPDSVKYRKHFLLDKKINQLNLFDNVSSVSDPDKEFKKDCAKKHGLERSFRGQEYKLTAIHLSKKEQISYINNWRSLLRKNGIKYRTFNTKDCFLTYTKHPLKKK